MRRDLISYAFVLRLLSQRRQRKILAKVKNRIGEKKKKTITFQSHYDKCLEIQRIIHIQRQTNLRGLANVLRPQQRKNTILNMENYKWCLHNSLTHKCSTSLIMQISLLTIGSLVLLVSLTLGVPFAAQLQLYL